MVYGMGATVQYNGTHIMSNELFIDSMGPSFAAGFNPVWNEVLRHVLSFPELALVRFRVMDYDRLSQDHYRANGGHDIATGGAVTSTIVTS